MTLLLVYLVIAIGVSFMCSVLEAVLLSTTPSYVEEVSRKHPIQGKVLIKVRERLDQSISSILILNTFAHTMGAAGVGAQAVKLYGDEWEIIIAILLTLAILYFSEIIPKTLGATYWRQLAMPSAHIIYWLIKLVYPLIWVATLITKRFRKGKRDEITRDEIIALASLGHKTGSLISQENEYLANVLKLREIKTNNILTPRTVIHSLSQELTVIEALEDERTEQFSRIPIYQQNLDSIIGLVTKLDLLQAVREGQSNEKIKQFCKPINRVSESLPVQPLLDLFIREKQHLFLVEDEYGQTAGVVTLEDAIETVLGREIVDETDRVEDLQEFARVQYRDRLRQNKK